jgi:hypothetical protein
MESETSWSNQVILSFPASCKLAIKSNCGKYLIQTIITAMQMVMKMYLRRLKVLLGIMQSTNKMKTGEQKSSSI